MTQPAAVTANGRNFRAYDVSISFPAQRPFAELAQAMIERARGQLPKPPPGTWWFVGLPTGPRTMQADGPYER